MIRERIRTWINVLIHPKKTFAEEKPKASLDKAVRNYLISLFLLPVIFFLFYFGIAFGVKALLGLGGIAFFFAILFFIFSFLVTIFSNLIAYYIMRFLGGKATFTQQFYLTSLYPAWFISIIFVLYAAILFVYSTLPSASFDPIIYLLLLLSLINLYWLILTIKETHNQSLIKSSVIAITINLLQWIIIFGVVYILFYSLILILGSMLAGSGGFGIGAGPGSLG